MNKHYIAKRRYCAIKKALKELKDDSNGAKNSPYALLKYGFVHESMYDYIKNEIESSKITDDLTFTELCSLDTYFFIHPEKVAGKDTVTTSLFFPIKTIGTKEDVIKAIKQPINNKVKMAKAKANAQKQRLRLISLNKELNGTPCCCSSKSSFTKETINLIKENIDYVVSVILKSTGLKGLDDVKVLSFDEIDKKHNAGITENEKKAWVWYMKSIGEPMNRGWRKYDISENLKGLGRVSSKITLNELVIDGCLFIVDEKLLPKPIYTFGNMYDRELQLENDKEYILKHYGSDVYQNHVKTIKDHKPVLISVLNIDDNRRPKILSFSKFSEEFEIDGFKEELLDFSPNSTKSLKEAFEYYLKYLSIHKKSEFKLVSAYQIYQYYVLGRRMGNRYSDQEKESILTHGPVEGERLFSKFLHEALTLEDQQKIDYSWNRINNAFAPINHKNIPIGFECSSKFKTTNFDFTPIQREGTAFMKAAGSACLAYDVGVGKTITAIITLANELYSGKCKRPLIVVPNQTYKKWLREIFGYIDDNGVENFGVLSGTKYKLNDWFNLNSNLVKELDFTSKVEDGTITVLTYEGFMKLGFSSEEMQRSFDELSGILLQEKDSDTKRDTAKQRADLEELIGSGNKGTIADIDVLGFDYLAIDEAHNFRNVFKYIPTDNEGNKRFSIESGQSNRAVKAFFLCNYIQKTYGSNVMLLTATPFTNNPIEIFSMTSLVGYNNMKERGIANLYDFMELFILQTREYVNNYEGSIVKKSIVKAFNNRASLQSLIFNHFNYKTGEDANVVRPCKIDLPAVRATNKDGQIVKLKKEDQLPTFLRMTEEQEENQAEIEELAISGDSPIERATNVMRALARSLDNALSPHIYYKTTPSQLTPERFVHDSPKLHFTAECIKSVVDYHKSKNQKISGQVIYMNRGKDYFDLFKTYLEEDNGFKRGIKFNGSKVDEVEIIVGDVSQERREIIKDAFLEGVCKIVIGTATIREGIDLQKNGSTLYDLYPEWNPTDVKQLYGRIYRQGNRFGFVRCVMPLVQNSMDVFVFQKLEEKTARINDIWYRAGNENVIALNESIDPEEVKFALYTNLFELAKIKIDKAEQELKFEAQSKYDEMKLVQEFDFVKNARNRYFESCKTGLVRWESDLKSFINDHSYVKSRWGASDAQVQEHLEKALSYRDEIQHLLTANGVEDKSIISFFNRFGYSVFANRGVVSVYRSTWDSFKEFSVKYNRSVKTFIERGYNVDNLNAKEIVSGISERINEVNDKIKFLKSEENISSIINEINLKRSENAIEGLSPVRCSELFSRFNYLLEFPANTTSNANCSIPSIHDVPNIKATQENEKVVFNNENKSVDDKTKRLKLAKAKANAQKQRLRILALGNKNIIIAKIAH